MRRVSDENKSNNMLAIKLLLNRFRLNTKVFYLIC